MEQVYKPLELHTKTRTSPKVYLGRLSIKVGLDLEYELVRT
jgi:hypothetical protein